MASVTQATIQDRLMLVPKIAQALAAGLLRLLTGRFAKARGNTLLKDTVFAVVRTLLSSLTPAQESLLKSTTEAEYLDFAKSKKFQPDIDVLKSGMKLYWIGPKIATTTLIFLHGGGFVLPANAGHFTFLFELQQELSKDRSVTVVVPSYTLAPAMQYPGQLRQAAECLKWLISTCGKRPGDIFVAGDSAGGNLALALMSHLLRPHPDIASDMHINLSEPLAGAILISPWCKFPADDPSVKRNLESDMLTPQMAARWSSLYLGSSVVDNYNQPIIADSAWFSGLDLRVKDVLVWGGGGEVLIDSIEAMAKKLKEAHPRTELVVEPGASHEDFILARLFGSQARAEGEQVVESWIAQRIR